MRGVSGGRAVGFEEQETARIFEVLHDVEAGDAGLGQTRAGVGERGGLEGVDALGFYANRNMKEVHGGDWLAEANHEMTGKTRQDSADTSDAISNGRWTRRRA